MMPCSNGELWTVQRKDIGNLQTRKLFYSCYHCREKFFTLNAAFDHTKAASKSDLKVLLKRNFLSYIQNDSDLPPPTSGQPPIKLILIMNKYSCPKCEYTTTEQSLLICHIFLKHRDLRMSSCSIRIYKIKKENMTDRHITEQRPDVKNVCDRTSQLKHRTSHISRIKFQRLFKCTFCGYTGTTLADLVSHQNLYHYC